MFLLSILLTTWLAIFQFADSTPDTKSIEPVNMNYIYVHEKQQDTDCQKPPVLLIHGVTSSINGWNGFYQNLTRRTNRREYLIDLRNHGESPWSDRVDAAALTADVENFLIQQNIEKVDLIGHSLGGKVAINIALKHPSKVSSLVVEDMRSNGLTFAGWLYIEAGLAGYRLLIKDVPDGSSEKEAKQIIMDDIQNILDKLRKDYTLKEDQIEIRQVNGTWMWKFNLDVISKAMKDPDEFLGTSTGTYFGPTLFIYGTKSPLAIRPDKKNIMKMFPNAKLIPIKGASHNIHGFFQKFEDEVVEFLNGM